MKLNPIQRNKLESRFEQWLYNNYGDIKNKLDNDDRSMFLNEFYEENETLINKYVVR